MDELDNSKVLKKELEQRGSNWKKWYSQFPISFGPYVVPN